MSLISIYIHNFSSTERKIEPAEIVARYKWLELLRKLVEEHKTSDIDTDWTLNL
jgi:hypothetical protein